MALVNPQIAMSYRPTVEYQPRNALADAAQIMSLQQAQMQMDKLRQTDEAIERIRQVAMKEGGPSDTMEIAKAFLSSPVAEHQSMGFKIYQQQKDKADFERVFGRLYPELTGGLTPAPANALVPPPAAANALVPPSAPAPAPASVNAMAPAGKTADQLRQEIIQLSNLNDPRAKALADVLKEQLKELTKTHTVGGQIVTGAGGVIHTAPSPIGMLESEIAALQKQGVPDTDPRIVSRRGKIGQLSGAGAPLDITRAMTQRDQLLASGLSPDHPDVRTLNDYIRKQTTHAPAAITTVQAFVPASQQAQVRLIESATEERKGLRNVPDTIANIDAAKRLIPSAQAFMGKGGEPLLSAASFLNNRLGFSINTKGVTDATELRTRLFEGILDNLKKLDSQPSQEQQRVLGEALGNLGTDPAALPRILDRIEDVMRRRVDQFNADVTEAEKRGVIFPFKPQLELPPRAKTKQEPAAQIPGQAPAAGVTVSLPDGRVMTFPNAKAAADFRKAAGLP